MPRHLPITPHIPEPVRVLFMRAEKGIMNLLSKLRTELGQLSYSFKRRNTPKLWRDQLEAIRMMKVHNLPAPHFVGPRREVWAVSVVKNELDILPYVLNHLFAQGVDRIIVADNLSTDGTREYLRQRAQEDSRLIFAEDNCDRHIQSEKITWLGGAVLAGLFLLTVMNSGMRRTGSSAISCATHPITWVSTMQGSTTPYPPWIRPRILWIPS